MSSVSQPLVVIAGVPNLTPFTVPPEVSPAIEFLLTEI